MLQARQQATKVVSVPAPMGGMNSESNLLSMTYHDSIYTFNLIAGEYGLQIREGYDSFSGPVPVQGNTAIRTIIGYRGAKDDGSRHKMFAATDLGIYDVSDMSQVIAFTEITGNSGFGVFTMYESIGGSYLFYCDEENGGFRYEEDLDEWKPIPDLTLNGQPFDPKQIVDVLAWKNRIWFTVRDSAVAYYLPIGQISGALTAFDFGNKFEYGGSLVGLWSWTVEGGNGPNDYLVAISRGGDYLIYQGIDPANANSFGLKGSWFIGALPAGRNFVYNYSGDLLVLTVLGVVKSSALLSKVPLSSEEAFLTKKINRFVREEMMHSKATMGWNITQHPRLGYLMVVAPPRTGVQPIQFVRAAGGSWTIFRGLPASCVGEYLGELYLGTSFDKGHKIFKMTGTLDDERPIVWSVLTSYGGYDAPGNFKRVQFIRPMFIGQMTPVYDVYARYDFDLTMISGSPRMPDIGVGIWDASLWDKAVWGEGYISDQKPYGGSGMGRHVAIAMRGSSIVATTFLGFDVMMDLGGML